MQIIDLSHTISHDMPVFPGTFPPYIKLTNNYQKDGFKESSISMVTHTGTHMDPPVHVNPNQPAIDSFCPAQFYGPGVVIDCHTLVEGEKITMKHLAPFRKEADQADFLLFYTGWDVLWGTEDYFGDYPSVDDDIIQYMLDTRKKGIGVDVIGLDPITDKLLVHHKQLFRDGDKVIIENLTNLRPLLCSSTRK